MTFYILNNGMFYYKHMDEYAYGMTPLYFNKLIIWHKSLLCANEDLKNYLFKDSP